MGEGLHGGKQRLGRWLFQRRHNGPPRSLQSGVDTGDLEVPAHCPDPLLRSRVPVRSGACCHQQLIHRLQKLQVELLDPSLIHVIFDPVPTTTSLITLCFECVVKLTHCRSRRTKDSRVKFIQQAFDILPGVPEELRSQIGFWPVVSEHVGHRAVKGVHPIFSHMPDARDHPLVELPRVGIRSAVVVVPSADAFGPALPPCLDQCFVLGPVCGILPLRPVCRQHGQDPWVDREGWCRLGPIICQRRQITRLPIRRFPRTRLVENPFRHSIHESEDQIRVIRQSPEIGDRFDQGSGGYGFVETHIVVDGQGEATRLRILLKIVKGCLGGMLGGSRRGQVRLCVVFQGATYSEWPASAPARKKLRIRFE